MMIVRSTLFMLLGEELHRFELILVAIDKTHPVLLALCRIAGTVAGGVWPWMRVDHIRTVVRAVDLRRGLRLRSCSSGCTFGFRSLRPISGGAHVRAGSPHRGCCHARSHTSSPSISDTDGDQLREDVERAVGTDPCDPAPHGVTGGATSSGRGPTWLAWTRAVMGVACCPAGRTDGSFRGRSHPGRSSASCSPLARRSSR